QVRGQEVRRYLLRLVEGLRHGALARAALRTPLVRAGRAPGQLPFETEQVFEEVVAELRRRPGPGDFESAGDRIHADAGVESAAPAETLVFEVTALRVDTDVRRGTGAVRLAEAVATGDQRHGLLVIHRHAGKGLADVARRGHRVGVAIRALRV